jgi:hypothetical protein
MTNEDLKRFGSWEENPTPNNKGYHIRHTSHNYQDEFYCIAKNNKKIIFKTIEDAKAVLDIPPWIGGWRDEIIDIETNEVVWSQEL